VVAKILQGENRERYDYFLANGFPKWRGTGYYYARFRPGLGSVLAGLFLVLGGGAHYGALVLSWKRQTDFIDRYIRQARRTAWGDETGIRGIPGADGKPADVNQTLEEPENSTPMNRRQKRQLERESKKEKSGKSKSGGKSSSAHPSVADAAPTGEKKRVVADNGKVLIVDSIGNVFLEEEDEDGLTQEYLLDPHQIPKPTMKDTALYSVPRWIYNKAVGRLGLATSKPKTEPVLKAEGETETENETDRGQTITTSFSKQDPDPGSTFEVIDNDGPADTMAQAHGTTKKRAKKSKNG
jgi:hypothetical protein